MSRLFELLKIMTTKLVGQKHVIVRTQFEALHCWPDAPEMVEFLRHPHRHIFYVTVGVMVEHGDRAVEFFILKRQVESIIFRHILAQSSEFVHTTRCSDRNVNLVVLKGSCEAMAEAIANALHEEHGYIIATVAVSEDNENTGMFLVIK